MKIAKLDEIVILFELLGCIRIVSLSKLIDIEFTNLLFIQEEISCFVQNFGRCLCWEYFFNC